MDEAEVVVKQKNGAMVKWSFGVFEEERKAIYFSLTRPRFVLQSVRDLLTGPSSLVPQDFHQVHQWMARLDVVEAL